MGGTMTSIVLFFIFCITTSYCQEEVIEDNERNPKILFATTTVTTTTVSTSDVCFIPTSAVSTGLLGCKKKKKKSLNIVDKAPKSSPEILPSPSSVQVPDSQDQFKEDPNQLVESGQVEEVRKGKQLLYWATYTSTYTHFTTTTTWTLKSVICTPFGWAMSRCAGS